jgi:hypothetical protein
VTGTEAAGATVIEVASTTDLVVGGLIFFKNTTLANSEWRRILAVVANTSITVEALTNDQTGSTIYSQAERFVWSREIMAIGRLRLVADCASTGRTVVVQAWMVTGDTFA